MTARWVQALLLATLLLVPCRQARASELPQPLALEEILLSVERAYPPLLAAELEQALAESELTAARGGFDLAFKARGSVTPLGYYEAVRAEATLEKPTPWRGLSAHAGWKLGTGEFAPYDLGRQTLEYGELRAGVQLPLWRNAAIDRRRANLARAELGRPIAELMVKERRIELRRQATYRYWAWLAAGRRLAVAETMLENVLARDGALRIRVESGDLPPIEQLENARAVEQRRAGLARARRGLEQAALELGLFLRDERGEPVIPAVQRLPRAFPEIAAPAALDRGADLARAHAARPEAQRLELQWRQQQIELTWSKNQLAPSVDLQLWATRDVGPALDSRPDLQPTALEATVLLDIPLETELLSGRVGVAQASLERLSHQARFARERIATDVSDAHSAALAARDVIDATRREVAWARELEAAERLRFEQGDGTLLLVNFREQQTADAELREIDAAVEYFRALADLKAARGE